MESHGDYRGGVFQEFARGFGVRDYKLMLQSGKANQTRLKLKSEIPDYWAQRENMAEMLRFIGRLPIRHWAEDAEAGWLLAGAVANDHV